MSNADELRLHQQFEALMTNVDRINYPATPERDGVDCRHVPVIKKGQVVGYAKVSPDMDHRVWAANAMMYDRDGKLTIKETYSFDDCPVGEFAIPPDGYALPSIEIVVRYEIEIKGAWPRKFVMANYQRTGHGGLWKRTA